jgi:hypothetical protein
VKSDVGKYGMRRTMLVAESVIKKGIGPRTKARGPIGPSYFLVVGRTKADGFENRPFR